ncbi:hypothetical protein [Streptomyces aidingensis]|nr:hypothetical protein [Streptomyces aidingensis]
MKISRSISEQFAPEGSGSLTEEEIEQGMLDKSREFADSGNRLYLPLAD